MMLICIQVNQSAMFSLILFTLIDVIFTKLSYNKLREKKWLGVSA